MKAAGCFSSPGESTAICEESVEIIQRRCRYHQYEARSPERENAYIAIAVTVTAAVAAAASIVVTTVTAESRRSEENKSEEDGREYRGRELHVCGLFGTRCELKTTELVDSLFILRALVEVPPPAPRCEQDSWW